MPAKFTSKDGVSERIGAAEVNVPVIQIKPTGFKETAPGIQSRPASDPAPSLNVPTERMGAAKPWISKAGHALAAANAKDPGQVKISQKFKPAPSKGYATPGKEGKGPVGPTATPAGQADAGGYSGASGSGGYS